MCGLCGALALDVSWEQEGRAGDDARWRLRREAVATASELTRLFASARIRFTAHADFGFIVAFPTGRTTIAAGLAQVWHLLDAARITIPDPLVS